MTAPFVPHWFRGRNLDEEPQGVVQTTHQERTARVRTSFPEALLRLAHEEYERQHPGQSFERIQERGGFHTNEVVALLADHVARLKAQAVFQKRFVHE